MRWLEAGLAFQRLWLNSLSGLTEAAWPAPAQAASLKDLRQARAQMLKALSATWDQFLRSPEFGSLLRDGMEQAVNLQMATSDVLTQARHQMQAPAAEDIDAVLSSLRALEMKFREQMAEFATRLSALEQRLDASTRFMEQAAGGQSKRRPRIRAEGAKRKGGEV